MASQLVTVSVRNAAVLSGLRNAEKRIRFAISNALNDTAKAVQAGVQKEVQQKFTLRKRDFILRQAAIITFASPKPGGQQARVRVGTKPRLLLSLFEGGGERKGQQALKRFGGGVAVPIGARQTRGSIIPETLWVRRLSLRKSGNKVLGSIGTFFIPAKGVFQRIADTVRALYIVARNTVRIPKRLGFASTSRRVAEQTFPSALRKHIDSTLRYAGLKR